MQYLGEHDWQIWIPIQKKGKLLIKITNAIYLILLFDQAKKIFLKIFYHFFAKFIKGM